MYLYNFGLIQNERCCIKLLLSCHQHIEEEGRGNLAASYQANNQVAYLAASYQANNQVANLVESNPTRHTTR